MINIYDKIKPIKSRSNYLCDFLCNAYKLQDTIDIQYIDATLHNSQKQVFDLENNFTFVIPVKIDSNERKFNLNCVIDFIYNNFINFKIIVSEQAEQQTIFSNSKFDVFYKKNTSRFFKTKCVNDAAHLIKTEFGCMYDADHIATPTAFYQCFKKLKEGYNFAHPSTGMNIYFNKHHTNIFATQKKLPLQNQVTYQRFFEPAFYPGLCFMFNTSEYFEVGLENENFITWGMEDHERFIRIEKLEKSIYYTPACGYHLWHPRNTDYYYKVVFKSDQFYDEFTNEDHVNELNKINNFNKSQLTDYISTWSWNKKAPLNH